MENNKNRIAIIVAVIGLIGSLGAVIIDKTLSKDSQNSNMDIGPHAPKIEINQIYTIWGEKLMQFYLKPGKSKTIKANELYEYIATYPEPSCAGPGFVVYTWQIRQPYPKGGDLEIRRTLQGGMTEQVSMGSTGKETMGYCQEHVFKNNGGEKIYVEIRYASAANLNN
ncbi:hypothetical protein [Galbibacter sp. PAP.153]|uniref:hypothetical protein n=1 Tax=Galbibacter sp. PAP.153 TaxID=3104623 RepID=UPI0030099AF3